MNQELAAQALLGHFCGPTVMIRCWVDKSQKHSTLKAPETIPQLGKPTDNKGLILGGPQITLFHGEAEDCIGFLPLSFSDHFPKNVKTVVLEGVGTRWILDRRWEKRVLRDD